MSKILILANDTGGLIRFRGLLIQELMKSNEVICAIPYSEEIYGLMPLCTKTIDIPMERRGMNPIKDIGLLIRYIKVLHDEKPDFVITYTIKPNAYGGIACRVCHVPYAVNITGLGTAFQGNGMLRKFVTVLYKIALKKSRVIFFENEENRNTIVDAGIVENERTHVLHGAGVDLERFQVSEYPREEGMTRFLFIGRVMREKGVEELFSAMQRLNENGTHCHLDILGGFDEDYGEAIRKHEAEGWLTYHGLRSDVRPYINNCHCFVLPSWHEGMANTNLECAASGRPVITSNIHGCLEAVEDGVSGYLCEKQNADSLYEVMKKFCGLTSDERKQMGLAGRKRMEDVFDKKKVVEETIEELMR